MFHLVFVYGTLKRNFPNHAAYMQSSEFLGSGCTVEKYPLVLNGDRHVPCVLNTPGKGFAVSGELYRVDDGGLQCLDELEAVGRPGGYLRRVIEIRKDGETEVRHRKAFAYLMKPESVSDVRSERLPEYTLEAARKYKRKS